MANCAVLASAAREMCDGCAICLPACTKLSNQFWGMNVGVVLVGIYYYVLNFEPLLSLSNSDWHVFSNVH